MSARDEILAKVKAAVVGRPTDNPVDEPEFDSPVFNMPEGDLWEHFLVPFTKIKGVGVKFPSLTDAANHINQLAQQNQWDNMVCLEPDLANGLQSGGLNLIQTEEGLPTAHVGITTCEAVVARTGSIIITNANQSGRRVSIYPPTHIVIAYRNQLMADLTQGLTFVKQKYEGNFPSMVGVVTGPSRTADIEKTLVLGAHGPKELYVFLIDAHQ